MTQEQIKRFDLVPFADVQEELMPSEYLAREPEKTIEEQWRDIFREGATA